MGQWATLALPFVVAADHVTSFVAIAEMAVTKVGGIIGGVTRLVIGSVVTIRRKGKMMTEQQQQQVQLLLLFFCGSIIGRGNPPRPNARNVNLGIGSPPVTTSTTTKAAIIRMVLVVVLLLRLRSV